MRSLTDGTNVSSGSPEGVWLTATEASYLLGISKQYILRRRKYSPFVFRTSSARGGRHYEILLSSLPTEARVKYALQHSCLPTADDRPEIDRDKDEQMELVARAPEYNRRRMEKYLRLFAVTDGLKGYELDKALEVWNRENPDMHASRSCLYIARKEYQQGGVAALLGDYGKTKGRSFTIEELGEVGSFAYERFRALFFTENRLTPGTCYLRTRGYIKSLLADDSDLLKSTLDGWPSLSTFVRALEKRETPEALCLARYGQAAYEKKYGNFINRQYGDVGIGEVWVGDHRQIDQVWATADGKYLRPYVTVWCDMVTGYWVAWTVSFDYPNTDRIINTFADGVILHGLPKKVIIDNGKDFRSLSFAGGRKKKPGNLDDGRAVALLSILGVEAHFALPYNARAKMIERTFREMKDSLDRGMPGFTGGSIAERPKDKLKSDMKSGAVLDFETGCEMIDYWVNNVFHQMPSRGKVTRGRSRAQAWNECINLERVNEESLMLLRSSVTGVQKLRRNGFKYAPLDDYYYAEWMEGQKDRRVYLRLPLQSQNTGYVYDAATHEFLGTATLGYWNSAAMAGTDVDSETLRRLSKQLAHTRKEARKRAAAQAIDPRESLKHHAIALKTGTDDTVPIALEPPTGARVTRLTIFDKTITQRNELEKRGLHELEDTYEDVPRRRIYKMQEDDEV